jgi:hypothetical protein
MDALQEEFLLYLADPDVETVLAQDRIDVAWQAIDQVVDFKLTRLLNIQTCQRL